MKKFTNLSKKELNKKNNKNPCARNDVMTTIIKRCRGKKERGIRAIDGFKKSKWFQILKFVNVQNLKLNLAQFRAQFRIDVYFSEYLLAVEIDEIGHTDRYLIFQEKRQEALEKKLGSNFIRINTSNAKNGFDLDYGVGNIEVFIDEFKKKKIKELEDKIKEKEEESNKRIKELEAKLKELEDKNKNSATI